MTNRFFLAFPFVGTLIQRRAIRLRRSRLNATVLFDAQYYLACNPDVAASGQNPLEHYLLNGASEGRDPHPLFDTAYYLSQGPVISEGISPLAHYLLHGASEGRDPHPLFDTAYYLSQGPVIAEGISPLEHYLKTESALKQAINPCLQFDTAYYEELYADVREENLNSLLHYVKYGVLEGRKINRLFDGPAFTAAVKAGRKISTESVRRYTILYPQEEDSLGEYYRVCDRLQTLRAANQPVAKTPLTTQVLSSGAVERPALDGLSFPFVADPDVSIILPFFNLSHLTAECLLSLVDHTDLTRCELILIDDGSDEAATALLAELPNVRYLRNETNQGFLYSARRGAEAARGRYLLFLNNDTEVSSGWLDALLQTFTDFNRVGAVGPKLVFPDGRLQEAGALIRRDGYTELIGAGSDPELPCYTYARPVDYCSGACLLVDRVAYEQVGGFDLRFAPAYYEDVDLCLKLRKAGFQIICNPSARVTHRLGGSGDQIPWSRHRVHLDTRRQKLMETWAEELDLLNTPRLIAFYLPQYHRSPENDLWWGKGYTEWHGVASAHPLFPGHHQPRLPADLGFYDLDVPQFSHEQAELARRYGVFGFCHYTYWHSGHRLLDRPIERLLSADAPDLPYCLAWANGSWTLARRGNPGERLIEQQYSPQDDEAFIRHYLRHFKRSNYIRVNGRPLFLVYRAHQLPDSRRTTDLWRRLCEEEGVGDLYLAMVESFQFAMGHENPATYGFDASVEFPPHGLFPEVSLPVGTPVEGFQGRLHDYQQVVEAYMTHEPPGFVRFRGVMPSWDNTPRYRERATVFLNASPSAYRAWLEAAIADVRRQNFGEERIVFINAWNEWGEGCILEPDQQNGHTYLQATRDALDRWLLEK